MIDFDAPSNLDGLHENSACCISNLLWDSILERNYFFRNDYIRRMLLCTPKSLPFTRFSVVFTSQVNTPINEMDYYRLFRLPNVKKPRFSSALKYVTHHAKGGLIGTPR